MKSYLPDMMRLLPLGYHNSFGFWNNQAYDQASQNSGIDGSYLQAPSSTKELLAVTIC